MYEERRCISFFWSYFFVNPTGRAIRDYHNVVILQFSLNVPYVKIIWFLKGQRILGILIYFNKGQCLLNECQALGSSNVVVFPTRWYISFRFSLLCRLFIPKSETQAGKVNVDRNAIKCLHVNPPRLHQILGTLNLNLFSRGRNFFSWDITFSVQF